MPSGFRLSSLAEGFKPGPSNTIADCGDRASLAGAQPNGPMPLFFIDTSDEDRFVRDETGHDFEDVEAAKAAAVDALPDMARDTLPDGDARTFLAVVRGADGGALLQASLTLHVSSMVPTDTR